ncbi:hypothetical protein ACN08Y_09930 [Rothia sp. P5764]|uniref:hypothetical protein n=1 Tax=Rothia sp. P5764 TaxID=3402654 RepID=UPI003AC7F020
MKPFRKRKSEISDNTLYSLNEDEEVDLSLPKKLWLDMRERLEEAPDGDTLFYRIGHWMEGSKLRLVFSGLLMILAVLLVFGLVLALSLSTRPSSVDDSGDYRKVSALAAVQAPSELEV